MATINKFLGVVPLLSSGILIGLSLKDEEKSVQYMKIVISLLIISLTVA